MILCLYWTDLGQIQDEGIWIQIQIYTKYECKYQNAHLNKYSNMNANTLGSIQEYIYECRKSPNCWDQSI